MKITTTTANIEIDITLNEAAVDGGVYLFLLDDIPLYIGETNIFLGRLTYHLMKLLDKRIDLKERLSYFGLTNLKGNHRITYLVLEDNLPYIKYKEEKKRAIDTNKKQRTDLETAYINKYYPLAQHPYPSPHSQELLSKVAQNGFRKKDNMLPVEIKNKIVPIYIDNLPAAYIEIISDIKKKHKNKPIC